MTWNDALEALNELAKIASVLEDRMIVTHLQAQVVEMLRQGEQAECAIKSINEEYRP